MQIIYAYKGIDKIGHIKYDIIRGDEQVPDHMELLAIWIDPAYQGQKHGTKMLNALVKIAKEQKISSIYVFVTKENEQFKKFLQKNKFVPDGKQELWHQSWS
jgi:ribosomal protein S18 acetylase RimI-like enzyme